MVLPGMLLAFILTLQAVAAAQPPAAGVNEPSNEAAEAPDAEATANEPSPGAPAGDEATADEQLPNSARAAFEQAVEEVAGRYVELSQRRQQLAAGNRFLRQQAESLPGAGPSAAASMLLKDIEWADRRVRQASLHLLGQNAQPVAAAARHADAQLAADAQRAVETWAALRSDVIQRRVETDRLRRLRAAVAEPAFLLNLDARWFWLSGLLAVGTLVGLVFHQQRHELRRILFGGARTTALYVALLAVLGLLAIGSVATFFYTSGGLSAGRLALSDPRVDVELLEPFRAEAEKLEPVVEELGQERAELLRRSDEAVAGVEVALRSSLPEGSPLPPSWADYRGELLGICEALAVLDAVPVALRLDREELETLRGEAAGHRTAIGALRWARQVIRGGLGLVVLALAGGGGLLLWRSARDERERVASVCPLCLGRDCLEPTGPAPGAAYEPEPLQPATGMVRCRNVISREPYQECDYQFAAIYQEMSKLCFPTMGVPQAGKTHWLAMLYWELSRGHYPERLRFEKLRTGGAENFDRIVEDILTARIGTAATQRDRIPHPVVFSCRDNDPLGRSELLVNIFDYSGEVTADMGVEDYRRRRALAAEGFFFFLDPTFPNEPQAKALADFREDLRVLRGLAGGDQLRTPIALCVSKIDLLAGQSYSLPGGGDAVEHFYSELGRVDPSGESFSWSVIRQRSRLTADLARVIWPGWEIERQIKDLFGGRYLFFPLTPVGLDGLGETDLSLRTISPFGLAQPLFWLLQMNGYPILDR
jgi:hypothetical protein